MHTKKNGIQELGIHFELVQLYHQLRSTTGELFYHLPGKITLNGNIHNIYTNA